MLARRGARMAALAARAAAGPSYMERRLAEEILGGGARARALVTSATEFSRIAVARLPRTGMLGTARMHAELGRVFDGSVTGRVSRRGLRWSHVRDLTELEARANSNPGDSAAQTRYAAALNRAAMPNEVMRRYESGRFAMDAEGSREYARALVAEGQIVESEFEAAASRALSQSMMGSRGSGAASSTFSPSPLPSSGGSGGMPAASVGIPVGTEGNPLVVRAISSGGAWVWAGRLLSAVFWAVVLYMLFFRRGSPGGGGPLEALTGSGQTEPAEVPETRFDDVKGVDEAKAELEDVVRFLREPERYTKLGAKVPKGVLLTGPPGTGKTLLARAVAGEAGVRFYAKSASEFEEMLVGLGARRVRDLFAQARANAPAIIFIDEIDAMGAKRGRVALGSGSERQTLNQLLACMDGFTKSDNVIVIAATNSPEVLDAALTRPGRFDTKVNVPLPDIKGRREILDLYLGRVRASAGVDAATLAAATPGMSGAMLEAMVNTAALLAANAGLDEIGASELEEARDKVWMGPALRSRKRTREELELTAWHEGGHTLAGLLTTGARELHKVTILARGGAGGVTFFLDDDDNMLTREKILAQIDVAMGGRVAEELRFGPSGVTTGAGQDMQQASRYARMYVKSFSMGAMGLTTFDENDPSSSPSPETQKSIDQEVESLLRDSHKRVTKLLRENKAMLERLATALLEHETLTADECRRVTIDGERLPPPAELIESRKKRLEQKMRDQLNQNNEQDEPASDDPKATSGIFGGWFGTSSSSSSSSSTSSTSSSSSTSTTSSTPTTKTPTTKTPTKTPTPGKSTDEDSSAEPATAVAGSSSSGSSSSSSSDRQSPGRRRWN